MTQALHTTWTLLSFGLCAAIACNTRNHQQSSSSAEPATVASSTGANKAVPNEPRTQCAQNPSSNEGACGADTAAADGTVLDSIDPKTGKPMQSVGAKLAAAPLVSVAALLREPDSYIGKVVRLEGDVTAMCHHRRGWFAIQDDGVRDGSYLRVTTAPGFLVPPGSIGRRARTEGTVDVVEVPEATARHYATEHSLGDGSAVVGSERRVVLRATGAEFI